MSRPQLRGVSHQCAFFFAWPAVAWLIHLARGRRAILCAAVYGLSLLGLLGTSTLFHRREWEARRHALMQRLDHSMIFVLIAGTYTPICLLAVAGRVGPWLLAAIWIGALLGIAQTLLWPTAPRALHLGAFLVLGWAGGLGLVQEAGRIGAAGVCAHVAGGVSYTLGAVIYQRRRPDPVPAVFGYHEIFHLLVLLGCGCLYDVVRRCVATG